jgi:hypothetical protein
MAVEWAVYDTGYGIVPGGDPQYGEPQSQYIMTIVPVEYGIGITKKRTCGRSPHDIADEIDNGESQEGSQIIPGRNVELLFSPVGKG